MIISPQFTGQLFTEPLGRLMLAGAGVSEVIGFGIIQKIVNIEV
jgi:tight adherence protein B